MVTLSKRKALELVDLADGSLIASDLPVLSLPFVYENNCLLTHFEKKRSNYIEVIKGTPEVRIQFVVGFHYVDPSIISRTPHAPTEIKAVFEFSGNARFLDRTQTQILNTLKSVTQAKQFLFAPESNWKINELPLEYNEQLLPLIIELEIDVTTYNLSQLMVLQHLSKEDRQIIFDKIKVQNTPSSRAVMKLCNIVYSDSTH